MENAPSAHSARRTRAFCFTINNPTRTDEYACRLLTKDAIFMIVGREVGECGTPHLQGYIRYNNPVTFDRVKKSLPRAHIEIALGTDAQNYEYCKKQDDLLFCTAPPLMVRGAVMT